MTRLALRGMAVATATAVAVGVLALAPAVGDTDRGSGGAATIALAPASTSGYPPSNGATVGVTITSKTPGLTYSYVKATVTVGGRPVATDVYVSPDQGLAYRRAWGRGMVGLTDVRGSGVDSRDGGERKFFNQPVVASVQRARVTYGVHYRSRLQVKRTGNRLRFTARARYLDARDRVVGIRRASIEVLDRGGWQTVRHLRLDRDGVGRWQRTTRARHKYRLVVEPTRIHGGKALRGTHRV